MLEIPQIADGGLRIIAVCAHVELGPGLQDLGDDEMVVAKLEGADGICVRKIIDSDEESGHFHVEAGLESAIGPFGEPGTRVDVLSVPQALVGTRQSITTWARFWVERETIPADTVIRTLSATPVPQQGGYRLAIDGCTLSATGDGPVKELRWWSLGDSRIGIEISAHCELEINDQLLVSAYRIIEDGLRALGGFAVPIQ